MAPLPKFVGLDRNDLIERVLPREARIAEVGVQRGRFARMIRTLCKPEMLYLIDCWKWLPGEYERDPANRPDEIREEEYAEAVEQFGSDPKATILRMMSDEAVLRFEDGALDAVYLDADHTLPGISRDIENWWPKVVSGGVLAGDDYLVNPWIDVKTAVDAFVARERLVLMVSGGQWPAWAVRKP